MTRSSRAMPPTPCRWRWAWPTPGRRWEKYHVLALIGDGALTGGLAYEGLSNAGDSKEPLIVILNDNGMSITKNVGGVAEHLARQRLKPQYLRFKKGYRKLMGKLPGGGHIYRFTHKLKTAIKGTFSRAVCSRRWASPIWDRWTATMCAGSPGCSSTPRRSMVQSCSHQNCKGKRLCTC